MTETPEQSAAATKPISPLTCWSGSLVSASIGVLMYRLTTAIAAGFAHQGLHTDNMTAYRLTIALRTLIVGLAALGTFIFGFVALGLFGLGVQRLSQTFRQVRPTDDDLPHR
jgi:hypothetical protein